MNDTTTQTPDGFVFAVHRDDAPAHIIVEHAADLFDDAKAGLLDDLKELADKAAATRCQHGHRLHADFMFLHDRMVGLADHAGTTITSPDGIVAYIRPRGPEVVD